MRAFIQIFGAILAGYVLTACQTPGFDYEAEVAPTYPEAAELRRVLVDDFEGPAAEAAEAAFREMVMNATLQGQSWFVPVYRGDPLDGVYSGSVEITDYSAEERFESERECDAYDGLSDCERYIRVEKLCTEETVEVDLAVTLYDERAGGTPVFTAVHGGVATRGDCEVVGEYPDDGYEEDFAEPVSRTYDPYNAPIGMIEDAAIEATGPFRYDIAPYTRTVRADILKDAMVPEVANDAMFEAAVKATRKGDWTGACAAWDALGAQWDRAPAVLHNQGACAEARGDLAAAQARYGAALELAEAIPLVKQKQVSIMRRALERVSDQRIDAGVIDRAIEPASDADTQTPLL